jgi:hypothetical protein
MKIRIEIRRAPSREPWFEVRRGPSAREQWREIGREPSARKQSASELWREMVEQYGLGRAIALMIFGPIVLFSLAVLLRMSMGLVLILAWQFIKWLASLL